LKYLEHKYQDSLTIIGEHSAKFDNEKETENILKEAGGGRQEAGGNPHK
jgi:hypothetical protein